MLELPKAGVATTEKAILDVKAIKSALDLCAEFTNFLLRFRKITEVLRMDNQQPNNKTEWKTIEECDKYEVNNKGEIRHKKKEADPFSAKELWWIWICLLYN